MYDYCPKRSRNQDLLNFTKKSFLSSITPTSLQSKEALPVIWSEEEYPQAKFRTVPNSDLNSIPDFLHATFEQEIAAHFLTHPLTVKKPKQHPV